MTYIIYTAISSVFLALYDLFKKISLKGKKDVYGVLFFFCLIAFLCSTFFIGGAFGINFKYIMFILLKSMIIALSWFLTTKAMSKLDMSIVVPFTLLGTVTTTILASLFFKENIGVTQITGIIIILIGLFLLSRISEKKENFKNDYKYLLLLALAAFLSSISAIIDKYLLIDIDRGSVLFWFFFFLTIIYFFVSLIKDKKILIKDFTSNLWVVGIGCSIFLSDLFYYRAVSIEGGSLSIISIVRKLSVFIGVVLASIFLKEKYFVKKILILILMFIGLGVILFL